MAVSELLTTEMQKLAPSAIIELFKLEIPNVEGATYFHAGTNEFHTDVVWQGQKYLSLPLAVEGFDVSAKGELPRPKISIANVQGLFSGLIRMYDDLIGAKLKVGELSKSGLKRADELCLELIVYLFAGIILLDIAADIGIEEHGVVYLIGIYARAADCDIDIKAYLRIDDTERNRVRSAELVVHQFLGVEIIDTLILSGIAAVGETLTDGLECLFNAVAERARENRGLRGGIICKLAGLRAELDYLALLDYHHALSVRNGYTRAVCDDVVAALCV